MTMSVDALFGTTITLLGKSLDLRVRNHSLISANLANVETPGYRPTSLSFEDGLREALKRADNGIVTAAQPGFIPLTGEAARLESVTGEIVEDRPTSEGLDGNGVEMDSQMAKLAENQIMFNANVQILSKKFESLKLAIKGGN
jgi:flagellar basal-body rod protein FlgB